MAAVGLTDRGSLVEFALMAGRRLRLPMMVIRDLGGLRRSLTGAATGNDCPVHDLATPAVVIVALS
jgi:hypothetical protein